MRNKGRGWLWVSASDDDGRTWVPPFDGRLPNSDSPTALLHLASGHLVLVYNDSITDRRPLSATISADEGVTWYPPRVLVDGDGAYAYPSAVQTPDGLVHIVYSHDRAWIGDITVNEGWIADGTEDNQNHGPVSANTWSQADYRRRWRMH
jgi:predicted neuraminidase